MAYTEPEVETARRLIQTYESAGRRNKQFNLSYFTLKNILKQTHCAYSGLPFKKGPGERLSLERFDNDKGYIDGNVIAVREDINSARASHSVESLEEEIIKAQNILDRAIARSLRPYEPTYTYVLDKTSKNYITDREKAIVNRKRRIQTIKSQMRNIEKKGNTANHAHYNSLKVTLSIIEKDIDKKQQEIETRRETCQKIITSKHPTVVAKEAEEKLSLLMHALVGLKKFSNLTTHQKTNIHVGLPVDTNKITTLKTKMMYNLFGGKL